MRPHRFTFPRDHCVWIAVVGGLVAIAICSYQLSLPNVLFGVHGVYGGSDGYDDGVYLGLAIRILHGAVPYKDYVLLQPPGIGLLMTPVAAIGQLVGDRDALVLARILTALTAGINAFLCGMIVRHHGKTAVFIASAALACFPLAVAANDTLLLEPYLVLFCLIGMMLSFKGSQLASSRRLFFGGVAFGFAMCIKLWAALAILALLIVLLPKWRSTLRTSALGVFAGFVFPTLPFFAFAPRAFLHEVIGTQFSRAANGPAGSSTSQAIALPDRLSLLTGTNGISGLHPVLGAAECIALAFVVLFLVYAVFYWKTSAILERYFTVSTAVVLIGMFASRLFYDHYAYFPAAFVAIFAGLAVGDLQASALRRLATSRARTYVVRFCSGGPIVLALCLFVASAIGEMAYANTYLGNAFDFAGTDQLIIPSGSCVITDFAPLTIDVNRFDSARPFCPKEIDPLGTILSGNNGIAPTPHFNLEPAALVDQLRSNLLHANYAIMSSPASDYLPWTNELYQWFTTHYRQLSGVANNYVYVHTSGFAAGSEPTTQ